MHAQVGQPIGSALTPEDVAAVYSRRQTADRAVVGAADERDVVAQSSCQFEGGALANRDAHLLLSVEGEVVHGRQFVVAIGTPRGSIAQILVVGALTVVATARIFNTRQRMTLNGADAVVEFAFQTQAPVEGFAVIELLDVPVARRSEDDGSRGGLVVGLGDEVSLLRGVDIGLRGGTAGMAVVGRLAVVIRQRAAQVQVREPALVEQPVQFGIGTEGIVAHLGIVVQLIVGVGL